MHAIEKILAKNSGRAEVHTGEIVTAKVEYETLSCTNEYVTPNVSSTFLL